MGEGLNAFGQVLRSPSRFLPPSMQSAQGQSRQNQSALNKRFSKISLATSTSNITTDAPSEQSILSSPHPHHDANETAETVPAEQTSRYEDVFADADSSVEEVNDAVEKAAISEDESLLMTKKAEELSGKENRPLVEPKKLQPPTVFPPPIPKTIPGLPKPLQLKPSAVDALKNDKSTYDMTAEKIYLPSTKDDYNINDLSSADDTDNEDQPRKDVPRWARPENLRHSSTIVNRLLTEQQITYHFGRIRAPDADYFFRGKSRQPVTRNSSAVWTSPLSDPRPGHSQYHGFLSGIQRK